MRGLSGRARLRWRVSKGAVCGSCLVVELCLCLITARMWVDSSHRRSAIAAEGGIRGAGATDPPVNDASEKEKEGCGLGPMMQRSRVFSAGATGPPAVTANIVSDDSYKAMNRSASSSSPVQDDAVVYDITRNYTTNNYTGLVSSIDSTIFPPNKSTSSSPPSDEDTLPPNKRPRTIDSEEHRKMLNLDKDASLVGSRDRQSFTEDRESRYLLPQDSGTAAENELDFLQSFKNGTSQSLYSIVPPAVLFPDNVTTSNVESTSNPSQLYRGEVAKEVILSDTFSLLFFIITSFTLAIENWFP